LRYDERVNRRLGALLLTACGKKDYQKQLDKELSTLGNSEMWRAGKAVRRLWLGLDE